MLNRAALYLQFALRTPAFWASVPAAFAHGPLWILYGVIASQVYYWSAQYVYWDHTLKNIQAATRYLTELQRNYNVRLQELKTFLPELGNKVGPRTRLLLAVATPKDRQTAPVGCYKAFTFPGLGSSLVVVSATPERSGPGTLFFMLHEVGHALFSGVAHTLNASRPEIVLSAIYVPLLLLLDWWPAWICLFACTAWHRQLEQRYDHAEVSADAFAFHWLSRLTSDAIARDVRGWLVSRWSGEEHTRSIAVGNEITSRLQGAQNHTPHETAEELLIGDRPVIGKAEAIRDELQARTELAVRRGPIVLLMVVAWLTFFLPYSPVATRSDPAIVVVVLVTVWVFLILTSIRVRATKKASAAYTLQIMQLRMADLKAPETRSHAT